jgi:hypothetical protein
MDEEFRLMLMRLPSFLCMYRCVGVSNEWSECVVYGSNEIIDFTVMVESDAWQSKRNLFIGGANIITQSPTKCIFS